MCIRDSNKHDGPLYYTGYIGSMCIKRIQVDSGSALRIIPKRLIYFLGIPLNRLSAVTTAIYGFNAGSSHPLGNIRLRCRIGDLKSEVTCYVIDAETSYNYCLGDLGFMLIGSFFLLCISASSMWMIMQWCERCLLKSSRSGGLKTTLLMLSSTRKPTK